MRERARGSEKRRGEREFHRERARRGGERSERCEEETEIQRERRQLVEGWLKCNNNMEHRKEEKVLEKDFRVRGERNKIRNGGVGDGVGGVGGGGDGGDTE